jgi:hypothetical protein
MSDHSTNSPSAMFRTMLCAGSKQLELDRPNTMNDHAIGGHVAHILAAKSAEAGVKAITFVSTVITIDDLNMTVTPEMAEHVQTYLDKLHQYKGNGQLLVERKLDFSSSLTTEDAWGTSDAVVLNQNEYQIHDFKYGRGHRVEALNNPQLGLYALGALDEFGLMGIERVVMVIHQPRLNHVSEWVATVDELFAFAQQVKSAIALAAQPNAPLTPGIEQCRYCRAKAICPALEKLALDEFSDLSDPKVVSNTRLGQARAKIELIQAWCGAITQETENRMSKGEPVPGMKFVLGKRGQRRWSDVQQVSQLLKGMRLRDSEIFDAALISPATAEKLFKTNTIGPRQWAALQPLITQAEPQPIVVPVNDPRPEIDLTLMLDLFDDIELGAQA